jgi:hypothetical protein
MEYGHDALSGLLLAGYAYAHILGRLNSLRREILAHVLILLIGLAFLPIAIDRIGAPPPGSNPIFWVVSLSLVSIGWLRIVRISSAVAILVWQERSSILQ